MTFSILYPRLHSYHICDVAATLFDRLMYQRIGLMLAFVIFLPVHRCQTEQLHRLILFSAFHATFLDLHIHHPESISLFCLPLIVFQL